MVRLPTALELRTNGAATTPAAATRPATTERRDNLSLKYMTPRLPVRTLVHAYRRYFLDSLLQRRSRRRRPPASAPMLHARSTLASESRVRQRRGNAGAGWLLAAVLEKLERAA